MKIFRTAAGIAGAFGKASIAVALVAMSALGPATSVGKPNTYWVKVPDASFGDTTLASAGGPAGGVATKNGATNLWIYAQCFQSGSQVYWENPKVDASGKAMLTLGPTAAWTGGAAECTAELITWSYQKQKWVTLATTTFSAAG